MSIGINQAPMNLDHGKITEVRPLNLMTQFSRRNGRKCSTPQKNILPAATCADEYNHDDDNDSFGSNSDDAPQGSDHVAAQRDHVITHTDVTEHREATSPAPIDDDLSSTYSDVRTPTEPDKPSSILEHYRSFMQRNGPEIDLPPKAKKPKTSSSSNAMDDQFFDLDFPRGSPTFSDVSMNGLGGLIPERTMRQNNWAIKVWRDWALNRNRKPETKKEKFSFVPVDIRVADVEVMSHWLPKFIKEVRRKDKKPYPADTLMQIASGLQRYLRQVSCRSEVNFFDKYSSTFAEFREALKSRSGELTVEAQAHRGKRIQVDNLNDDELWQSGYLGSNTAKGMFHAMFYYNCVEFEVTSMEEHHELKVEQFTVAFDQERMQEYIEFRRSEQRYYNMSTKRAMRRYICASDPRCLVKLYKAYLELVPSIGPFYRRPLQTSENSFPRFSFNPVGINKLRETFKQLFTTDRPASMRRSGKTKAVLVDSPHNSDNEHHSTPSPTNQSVKDTSQALYDAITQKLLRKGHLKLKKNTSHESAKSSSPPSQIKDEPVVNFSDKNEYPEMGLESSLTPQLTAQEVLERLRKSWNDTRLKMNQAAEEASHVSDDVTNHDDDTERDDVITMKVPSNVRTVIIERGGKKMAFNLD